MRYPKLRELKEAIRALSKGPYTSKFPLKGHMPPKTFRGKPKFYEDKCVGCGACFEICPAEAITLEDIVNNGKATRRLTHYADLCIFCGQCQANCITQEGIVLSQDYDLAVFERKDAQHYIEKDLLLCQSCGATVGCADHVDWINKKLGALSYSNPTLFLSGLKNLFLVEEQTTPAASSWRSDRMKIVCAKCRRQIVFKS